MNIFSEAGAHRIQEQIEKLRVDLGASSALLLNDAGQLLAESGRLRGFDIDALLVLLGNALSATNAVVHLLHDDTAFDLHLHEGQYYEMYSTRLTDQVFLTIILERSLSGMSRIGMVWLTLRRAVTDLRALVKKSMIESVSAKTTEIKNGVNGSSGDSPRPRAKLPGRGKPQVAEPAPEPPKKEEPSAEPPKPPVSSDILNDPNHQLTYEEARTLGLIDLDNLEAD